MPKSLRRMPGRQVSASSEAYSRLVPGPHTFATAASVFSISALRGCTGRGAHKPGHRQGKGGLYHAVFASQVPGTV